MTQEKMAKEALAAMQSGTLMTLVHVRGKKLPPGFPRGEFLRENSNGQDVYSYDPSQIIAWINSALCGDVTTENKD